MNTAVSTNATTGHPLSRAARILSHFDVDPNLAAEIYDAVLTAKASGISQSEVFGQFVKKYNTSPELQAKIQKVMADEV